MSMRISFARFLLRLGELIQSLPVAVMRPDDLVEFSRQSYARTQNVEGWSEDALVDSGFHKEELDLLSAIPERTGNLLLLGMGGGREAIPLAKMGFNVTGVDYVPAMVDRAVENAARRGISIDGLVQDISQLNVQAETYDVVWLSIAGYSCVPTQARRVGMVRRIAKALKPGGFFLCQFHLDPTFGLSKTRMCMHRLVAFCTLGNIAFEKGDMLWGNTEFLHAFASQDEIRSELEEGGLSVLGFQSNINNPVRCGVICSKNL